MSLALLDNPLINNTLFYPRSAQMGTSQLHNVIDGTLPVDDDVVLGYRGYQHPKPTAPLLLFFHGNGEIATDYDGMAQEFLDCGVSLLVVDYRGYGWSTGEPKVSTLLSDVEAVHNKLPDLIKTLQLESTTQYIMGRSLGSAPAIHLAHQHPETYQGIIIESGFAHVLHLLMRRGFPSNFFNGAADPVGNLRKIKNLDLPLLVIHGEKDQLIPVNHGQELYDNSPAETKKLLRIRQAGHNDLLWWGKKDYFDAIRKFIKQTSA